MLRQRHFRRTHKTKINLARLQGVNLVQRRHLMQGERNIRIKLAVTANSARKQRCERRGKRKAHTQFASLATLRPARPFRSTLGLRKDGPRIFEKQLASLGQSHPALAAIEQARAHFRFQSLDLLRQGRLADMQPFGRASEAQLLGYGHEIAQVTQFHNI